MRIKNLLLAVCAIIFAPVLFVGCDNQQAAHIYVSWIEAEETTVNIAINSHTPYQIKYTVVPSNATDKRVSMSSNNTDIVTVDEDGFVSAVALGTAKITIKSLDYEKARPAEVVVNVLPRKVKLDCPSAITYESASKRIVWQEVYTESFFKPSYLLEVDIDGKVDHIIVPTNTYKVKETNKPYSVRVKTLGNDIMYNDSEYSSAIDFIQLGTPEKLQLVSTGSVDTGDRKYFLKFKMQSYADSIDKYEVDRINAQGGALTNQEMRLWDQAFSVGNVDVDENKVATIKVPETLIGTSFRIRLRAKADIPNKIYASDFSEYITISKLAAPKNLNLFHNKSSQYLTWDSVKYASQYKIMVQYILNNGETSTETVVIDTTSISPTSFDFANLKQKPEEDAYSGYIVYMYAIGSNKPICGVNYLDSSISDCPAKQQLNLVNNIVVSKDSKNQIFNLKWDEVPNAQTYKVYVCPMYAENIVPEITEFDRLACYVNEPRCKISFDEMRKDLSGGNTKEALWAVGRNFLKIVACPLADSDYLESEPILYSSDFIKLDNPKNFKVYKGKLVWDAVENAQRYVISFDGKDPIYIDSIDNATSYSYEPTFEDMPKSNKYYYPTIRAINEDKLRINSSAVGGVEICRYSVPTGLKVEDGSISWSSPTQQAVEVKIMDAYGHDVVPSFVTLGKFGIEKVLQEVGAENSGTLQVKIRTVNNRTNDYKYTSSEWTKAISTYQLPKPKNLRINNGVITWEKFEDLNIDPRHKGIRYQVQIDGADYETESLLDINSTQLVIKSISANSICNITMKVVIDDANSGAFGNTILNSDSVYIINSNYSDVLPVKQLASPTNVRIDNKTLYWTQNANGINKYLVKLYRMVPNSANVLVRSETPIFTKEIVSEDPLNPQYAFATDILGENIGQDGVADKIVLSSGSYQFAVQAIGNDYDTSSTENYGLLNSYNSEYINIHKLKVPTLDFRDGKIIWEMVTNDLNNQSQPVYKYIFKITVPTEKNDRTEWIEVDSRSFATNFNQEYGLPKEFCDKNLKISIKAVSSWSNVYDSDLSPYFKKPSNATTQTPEHTIVKQNKIATSADKIVVTNDMIQWTEENVEPERRYEVRLYSNNGIEQTLEETFITGDNYYYIPNTQDGGKYFIKVMKKGFYAELDNKFYLDSEISENILFERFYKPISLKMTRKVETNAPVLSWSMPSVNEHMRFKINIRSNGVGLPHSPFYLPYDTTSLDLYGQAYNDAGELIDIDSFDIGSLQISIQTVPARVSQEGEMVLPKYYIDADGNKVFIMSSASSSEYNAEVYKAPNVTFTDKGLIKLNKINAYDKGVQMIFTPLNFSKDSYSKNTGAQIKVAIPAGIDEYDMSGELADGVKYHVQLRALGNTSDLITSMWEDSRFVIQKLSPLNPNTVDDSIQNATNYDGWYVKDGKLYWNKIEGVKKYEAYVTDVMGDKMKTFEVISDTNTNTYFSGVSNINYGKYNLQFKLYGGDSQQNIMVDGVEYTLGYVSSEMSKMQEVVKLYAPNDYENVQGRQDSYMRVIDGEFDWGLRDADTEGWIDCVGVTGYMVKINENTEMKIDTNFVASEPSEELYAKGVDSRVSRFDQSFKDCLEVGANIIQVYSVGNTWRGTKDNNTIYLTSDCYNSFILENGGVVEDFCIKDGKLHWGVVSNDSNEGYDLIYTNSSSAETKIKHLDWTQTSYGFEGEQEVKGIKINNIKVRNSGSKQTNKGAYRGFINTEWCAEMNNIIKLPDIEKTMTSAGNAKDLCINKWGQLAWTYGEQYISGNFSNADLKMHLSLDIMYYGQKVGGNAEGWDIEKPLEYFDVPSIDISKQQIQQVIPGARDDGILKYVLNGYVKGTQQEIFVAGAGSETHYLNSDAYSHDAYKLNKPTMFELDRVNGPGLRIKWDISSCNVSGYEPAIQDLKEVKGDQILLTFIKNDSNILEYKSFTAEQIGQIPLWEVAFYNKISLAVLNSDAEAFASHYDVDLNNVSFKYFDSGEGTREKPFVIKDNPTCTAEEQLGLVYWLPELYFELGQNIKLTNLKTIQENTNSYAVSNFPVPQEFRLEEVDAVYKKMEFTGGFNGKNYTISNYQTKGATSFGWWKTILGGETTKVIEEDSFYNRKGIITNLNIVAYEIDISKLAADSFNGVFAEQNFGWILNSSLDGVDAENRHDLDGAYIPVIQGSINAKNVVVGGITGMVARKEVLNSTFEEFILYEGYIENCKNLLDIKIPTTNNLSYEPYVGGIAGYCLASKIINCENGTKNSMNLDNTGVINGCYTGGIAGGVNGIKEDGEKEIFYYPYIVGCKNYANISGDLHEIKQDIKSASGGIVGCLEAGYATYCINYGDITTNGVGAALGGIVGMQNMGSYTLSCVNTGKVIFEEYYYDISADIPRRVFAGGLVGLGSGGNLFNSLTIADSVNVQDSLGQITTYNQYIGKIEGITVSNINDTIVSFTAMSQDALNNLLDEEDETTVNQKEVWINNDNIKCIYNNIAGLCPIVKCEPGQNPVLQWVSRTIA